MCPVLLEAQNLTKHFPVTRGLVFTKQVAAVRAVDGIDFTINSGETIGLVGESGCGKTTVAKLILRLEEITTGVIQFEGRDISHLAGIGLSQYRRSVQAVLQDPYSSLNPRMKVGEFIAEPMVVNSHFPKKVIKDKVHEMLGLMGLAPTASELYPHMFSGGQRQRIALARAIILNPKLVVLDEPISALDVSIRAQMMNLLRDVQDKFKLAYLFIAHDLAVVQHMSVRIAVMYLGKIVETSGSDELCRNPIHPYTQALLSATLPSHPDDRRPKIILAGEVPSPLDSPAGCRFHTRCVSARPDCAHDEPKLKQVSSDHWVACHL